jgi:hypothetical protein
MIKLRRMRWGRHGEEKLYKVVRKPEGKRPLRRPGINGMVLK